MSPIYQAPYAQQCRSIATMLTAKRRLCPAAHTYMAPYILQGAEDTCSLEGVHLNPTSLGTPLHSYTKPLEHYTFSVLPHSPHTSSHTPQHPAQHQWDSEMHGPEQQHNTLSSIFSLLTTTQPQTSSVSLLLLLFVEDYSTYIG